MSVGPDEEVFVPETNPNDAQKYRLMTFLLELKELCETRGLLLVPWGGDIGFYDLQAKTMVGVGLHYILDDLDPSNATVHSLESLDSILDGVWLVDGPDGKPTPQYLLNKDGWSRG
jgi:hypothetical protein